jgi:hypothetical protein
LIVWSLIFIKILSIFKEKITKVLQLWQKNNIFSNDLIEKLTKLTDFMSKNDYEAIFKGSVCAILRYICYLNNYNF